MLIEVALSMLLTAAAPTEAITATPDVIAAEPIALGNSYSIASAELGRPVVVNIIVPASYGTDFARTYPVLYLIDGGVQQDLLHMAGTAQLGAVWGRMADIIVVGIQSVDRRRELVGPTADPKLLARYPSAGLSAAFRRALATEIKPFVEATVRASEESGVIGESLAGLFVLETWLAEPTMFTRYAAISPSLWWDKAALVRRATGFAARIDQRPPLYLATEQQPLEDQGNVDQLVAALKDRSEVCYAPRPTLTHATIYHSISPTALQFLFPALIAPDPQMGFEVLCSPKS